MNFFDKINDGIRNVEASFVNVISSVAPWLAPIIPAYMTFQHATGTLDFPLPVAISAAVVVEILGFSAISTFMAFWYFNRRNVASSKKAPVGWVVFSFMFYLALIVTSNILLDATEGTAYAAWAVIGVRALFTLQTIPAAVIVIARAGHRNLLSDIAKEKAERDAERERKEAETGRKLSETEENIPVTFPSDWRKTRAMLTNEQVEAIAVSNSKDISFLYGVSERTARNWRTYAQAERKQ
jgi:hypothetical protein